MANRPPGGLIAAGRIRLFALQGLCLLLVWGGLPGAAGGQEPERQEDALLEARLAAEADRHEDAIELYHQALDDHPEAEALIAQELAYQYTWNSQLAEAETWFLHSLDLEPNDPATLLGLARVVNWQGRYEEALGIYRRVLEEYDAELSDDQRFEANLGMANMLGNLDRLDEADAVLEGVLKRNPDEIDAMLDHARITNWLGRHQEAAGLYHEILEIDPDNEDAIVGLAQAERWYGRDYLAAELLDDHTDNAEAARILGEIRAEQQPLLRQNFFRSTDSDELEISTWTTSLEGTPTPRITLRGSYIHETLEESGFPRIKVVSWDGGGRARLGSRFEANAYFRWNNLSSDQARPLQDPNGNTLPEAGQPYDEKFWTFDAWGTYYRSEALRFDLGVARGFVETPRAAAWEVKTTSLSLGSDYKIRHDLLLVGSVAWRTYSDIRDDNTRWDVRASVRYNKYLRDRNLGLSVEPEFATWGFDQVLDPNRGYYNPSGYLSLGVTGGARWDWRDKIFVQARARIAAEKERDSGFFSAGGLSGDFAWVVWRTLRLESSLGYSRSRLNADAGSGGAGYSRSWFTLQLGYRF